MPRAGRPRAPTPWDRDAGGAAPTLPPLRPPTLSPARVSEHCLGVTVWLWHPHGVTGTSGARGMCHRDRLGTARALPGSPPHAGWCCWDNVFPIAVSPAPLRSKPPASAHSPATHQLLLPNTRGARGPTLCRGHRSPRHRGQGWAAAPSRDKPCPAAPAPAGWSPSCPHPGNTVGTCISPKNSPSRWWVPVVAQCLAASVPLQIHGTAALSRPVPSAPCTALGGHEWDTQAGTGAAPQAGCWGALIPHHGARLSPHRSLMHLVGAGGDKGTPKIHRGSTRRCSGNGKGDRL